MHFLNYLYLLNLKIPKLFLDFNILSFLPVELTFTHHYYKFPNRIQRVEFNFLYVNLRIQRLYFYAYHPLPPSLLMTLFLLFLSPMIYFSSFAFQFFFHLSLVLFSFPLEFSLPLSIPQTLLSLSIMHLYYSAIAFLYHALSLSQNPLHH